MKSAWQVFGFLLIAGAQAHAEPIVAIFPTESGKPTTLCDLTSSKMIPIAFKGSVFDFPLNDGIKAKSDNEKIDYHQPFLLAAQPGGIIIKSWRAAKTGGKMEEQPLEIFRRGDQWCADEFNFLGQNMSCERKFNLPQEIKNQKGETVAVVVPGRDTLKIKQAKAPFKKRGYEIDSAQPEITIRYSKPDKKSEAITTFTAASKSGQLGGKLQIKGDATNISQGRMHDNKFAFQEVGRESGCLQIPKLKLAEAKIHLAPEGQDKLAAGKVHAAVQ